MTISPFDHPYLSGLLGDDEIAGQFSIEEDEERMFYFEEALSRALAEEGIIPEAAKEIYPVAPFVPDRERLRATTARDGTVGPGYVAQLREALGSPAGDHVHFGATSQDLVDTALILRLRPVLDIYEERLKAFATALARLEGRFGDRSLMGVTRMQDALPITVSDRIAAWHGPIPRHLDRLKAIRPRLLVLQFGGAVGVLDKLGGKGMAVARRVSEHLDLRLPQHSWHTQRDNVVEFTDWCALVAGSLGKFGQDIALMALRGDIEISGGGTSSAMPHKQNPVAAEVLVSLARYAATLAPGMHHAQVHELERSGSAWTLEWLILPQLAMATGAALRIALELCERIESIGGTDNG